MRNIFGLRVYLEMYMKKILFWIFGNDFYSINSF